MIKTAVDFSGESPRKSFWLYILITHIVALLILCPGINAGWQMVESCKADPGISTSIQKSFSTLEEGFDLDDSDYIARAQWEARLRKQFEKVIHAVEDAPESIRESLSDKGVIVILSLIGYGLYAALLFIPTISFVVRRLRDGGFHPAWAFLMIAFIFNGASEYSYLWCNIPPGILFILLLFPSKPAHIEPQDKEK